MFVWKFLDRRELHQTKMHIASNWNELVVRWPAGTMVWRQRSCWVAVDCLLDAWLQNISATAEVNLGGK